MTQQKKASTPWCNQLDFVDVHFKANRVEYEAAVRSVDFEKGWHVLDAGCGGGGFIPWLADLVGPSGQITALDISPENIEALEPRLREWELPCKTATKVGSFLEIPYEQDSFDAVWCSNAIGGTDEEFQTVLKEFKRVVRPGGIVAVKSYDSGMFRTYPPGPMYTWHLQEAGFIPGDTSSSALVVRAGIVRRWLERVGLEDVWQKTFLMERWGSDMDDVSRESIRRLLTNRARIAQERDLPEEDKA